MFDPITPNPNCTMRRDHFDEFPLLRETADELCKTMRLLHDKDLLYSSWVSSFGDGHIENTRIAKGPDYVPLPWAYDDDNIPWFTLWEYSWVLRNSGVLTSEKPLRILDLGGSSSVFDALLGLRGHKVVVVDRNKEALENARYNAEQFGYDLEGIHGDFIQLPVLLAGYEGAFDCVLSVSVLFFCNDICHTVLTRNLHSYVKPSGLLAFSFDFLNPHPVRFVREPISYFDYVGFSALPKGAVFVDHGERHHLYRLDPSKGHYTAAALFLGRSA